jgi:hypothetical protein
MTGTTMSKHYIFAMPFAKIYPLYVQKAERKNRTKEEVDRIICWLTGYDQAGVQRQIEQENDLEGARELSALHERDLGETEQGLAAAPAERRRRASGGLFG